MSSNILQRFRLSIEPIEKILGLGLTFSLSLGVIIVFLQCIRAGHLPSFDWDDIASTAVAVFAVAAVLFVGLATFAVIPGIFAQDWTRAPMANKHPPDVRLRKQRAVVFGAFIAVLYMTSAANLLVPSWFGAQWPQSGERLLLTQLAMSLAAALVLVWIGRKHQHVEQLMRSYSAYLVFAFICANCVWTISTLALASSSLERTPFAMLLGALAISGGLGCGIVAYGPREPAPWIVVFAASLIVFAWPVADRAPRLLGLGGFELKWAIVDREYESALTAGRIPFVSIDERSVQVHNVHVNLRLGRDVVFFTRTSTLDAKEVSDTIVLPSSAFRATALRDTSRWPSKEGQRESRSSDPVPFQASRSDTRSD